VSSTLATAVRLVPEGPLHPLDALTFALLGVTLAFVVGRHTGRWVALVVAGAFVFISVSQGDVVASGFIDHGERLLVLGTTAGVIAVAAGLRMRWTTAALVSLSACAGVWAVVPDTEVPLMAGSLLVGATAVHAVFGSMPGARHWFTAALLLLPLAGAAAGSAGRPARFAPAVIVGLLVVFLGIAAVGLLRTAWSLQRAGTPTTVSPGATSSMTTAPAPTTAP